MTKFIYLHGFASSPSSKKATAFKNKFKEMGISLEIPDLEGGDFENMTLTRQMNVLSQRLDQAQDRSVCLIGSSMGAYIAVLAAQNMLNIKALYLMAPGFNFMDRWMRNLNLDYDDEASWKAMIPVFHYRYGETKHIHTRLFKDAMDWSRLELKRKLPTRIIHGVHDEVVPIGESRKFVNSRPWCLFQELDDDHSLLSHIDWIIDDCLIFFSKLKFISIAYDI
jgi:hypothetical protein